LGSEIRKIYLKKGEKGGGDKHYEGGIGRASIDEIIKGIEEPKPLVPGGNKRKS